MSNPLAEKVVVVTGGGRGLGRAFSLAFAAAGAHVVVNDVGAELDGQSTTETPAAEVVAEIAELGGQAVANADSVATPEGGAAIIETAMSSFGRIDVVVNNAGIVRDRSFHKMSQAEWTDVLDVHLSGTYHVSRSAVDHFRRQESGAFIHMTSTAGLIGAIGQANYAAAKLGIVALSRSLATEGARYGVRSNCIAPFAWSRMTGSVSAPADDPEFARRVERLKSMDPAKVAPLAVYLGSDLAHQVTGQVFAVRSNEIFLMSQPRPIRGMHTAEGWTVESIQERFIPAVAPDFYGLDRTGDVFSWDPV